MLIPVREAAWALVCEWTASESLRKHMLAVEAAVRGYARVFNEDEEAWGVVAVLHATTIALAPRSMSARVSATERSWIYEAGRSPYGA